VVDRERARQGRKTENVETQSSASAARTTPADESCAVSGAQITYIGHATLLIEIGGKRILTDPNFDPALARFLRRVCPPGVALDRLPDLDAVLVTHAHADHLSFTSLAAIQQNIPVYAPGPVQRWLKKEGYRQVVSIDSDETIDIGGVTIHATSAEHRGNRYGFDSWRSAANMYLLQTPLLSCFFAGDTGLIPSTHQLVERTLHHAGRQLDIALLPIGYAPWWKPRFRRGHLSSDDALTLFERLRARYMIPYHWGTFHHLTSGPFDAITALRRSLITHPRRDDVKVLEPGMTFTL
jgi:L-ascorbate metabolism protein UlaG (beta-lactamase superfamily)